MHSLFGITLGLIGGGIGVGAQLLLLRVTPKFKPGTRVSFYDGECWGRYVRHSAWGGFHRVIPEGPSWLSAARESREITVHASRDHLREVTA